MASSSSISFINEWKYDVFLNFRGIDTRSGFTGNLHRALRGKEIKSFMDDKDLEKGSEINPALDQAIQSSRIALVILSKNYASSTFCLDELGKIVDCLKDKDMLVLPVFYDVEPCDVRYQKGKYADALIKHAARHIEKEKIAKWRVALKNIADLNGWSLKNYRYEYELIDAIVQHIIKKIQSWRDDEKNKTICIVNDKYVPQLDQGPYCNVQSNMLFNTFNNDTEVPHFNQFKEDIPIKDNLVLSNIHQSYRGGFLKRVKVYRWNDDRIWEYQGTGLVNVYHVESWEELVLFIYGKDNETKLLHRITSDDIYRKHEDRIISWREPKYAIDLALSFQEPSGCSYIWDHICDVQKNMQFNNFNSGNSEYFDKFSDENPNACSIM